MEASERFAWGERTAVIARDLRVSERSVERWRWAWREGGAEALRSAGPPKAAKLSGEQFALLEEELGRSPAAHDWQDQHGTLERVRQVIERRFRVTCSVAGVWRLLHRYGWSWQQPARRAIERDDAAVEIWRKETWPRVSLAFDLGKIISRRALSFG